MERGARLAGAFFTETGEKPAESAICWPRWPPMAGGLWRCRDGTGVAFSAGIMINISQETASTATPISLDDRLRELEASLISWALTASRGNKSKAARLLQVKRSTLGDRINRCGLGRQPETEPAVSRPRRSRLRARRPLAVRPSPAGARGRRSSLRRRRAVFEPLPDAARSTGSGPGSRGWRTGREGPPPCHVTDRVATARGTPHRPRPDSRPHDLAARAPAAGRWTVRSLVRPVHLQIPSARRRRAP